MIVPGASAALTALLNAGPARQLLSGQQLHAPHLIDSEVANGLRRTVASGEIPADAGWAALDAMRRLGMTRYPGVSLLDRVWELRQTLSASDATCVALAERLECGLVTAGSRLTRAPGIRCPVTVVPR